MSIGGKYLSQKSYLAKRPNFRIPNLFLNRFKEPLGSRGVQKMLSKCLKRIGLERASAQTLRHTFSVHHIARGIKTVREVMGHKDARSITSYIDLARKMKEHAL